MLLRARKCSNWYFKCFCRCFSSHLKRFSCGRICTIVTVSTELPENIIVCFLGWKIKFMQYIREKKYLNKKRKRVFGREIPFFLLYIDMQCTILSLDSWEPCELIQLMACTTFFSLSNWMCGSPLIMDTAWLHSGIEYPKPVKLLTLSTLCYNSGSMKVIYIISLNF